MPGKFKARGIVMRRTKLAESDLIITLLADRPAQLRVVAKGARKPASKLAGAMNLGNEVELLVSEGRSLGVVSEARLVRSHAKVAGEYDRAVLVDAVLDCACELTAEGDHDPRVLPLLSATLDALEAAESDSLPLLAAAFVLKAAAMQGFRPCLDTCVRCGEAVELAGEAQGAGGVAFDIAEGGVVCPECAGRATCTHLPASTLAWAQALISMRLTDICAYEFPDEAFALACGLDELRFAQAWLGHYPGVRPRALDFALSAGLF